MHLFIVILGSILILGCSSTPKPCSLSPATPGSSQNALIDRVYLNTAYYFMDYPAEKRDDIYWTMDFAGLKRDSGEKTNCLDDSYVRNAFEIRISEQTQTSATVDIFSKDPGRHNWFDIYKGTAEVWQLDSNNNWKLYESKTYILTGSPFDGNYW